MCLGVTDEYYEMETRWKIDGVEMALDYTCASIKNRRKPRLHLPPRHRTSLHRLCTSRQRVLCLSQVGNAFIDEDGGGGDEEISGKTGMCVVFQLTSETTLTIFYRRHWLQVSGLLTSFLLLFIALLNKGARCGREDRTRCHQRALASHLWQLDHIDACVKSRCPRPVGSVNNYFCDERQRLTFQCHCHQGMASSTHSAYCVHLVHELFVRVFPSLAYDGSYVQSVTYMVSLNHTLFVERYDIWLVHPLTANTTIFPCHKCWYGSPKSLSRST